jgi:hypothetical protein
MALSLGFAPGARNEPAGLAVWYAHFFAMASHRNPGRYFLDDEGMRRGRRNSRRRVPISRLKPLSAMPPLSLETVRLSLDTRRTA